jgi:hypothetical protein
VEAVAAVVVLAGLVLLFAAVSRRFGAPRLYTRPVVALWIVAALFALLLLWLAVS